MKKLIVSSLALVMAGSLAFAGAAGAAPTAVSSLELMPTGTAPCSRMAEAFGSVTSGAE